MLEFVVWIVVVAGLRMVRAKRLDTQAPAQSLCHGCTFAHVQYATNGKRVISCTYGGGVRLIKLDVLYCTDYSDRNAPRRVVTIGFAKAVEPVRLAEAATTTR